MGKNKIYIVKLLCIKIGNKKKKNLRLTVKQKYGIFCVPFSPKILPNISPSIWQLRALLQMHRTSPVVLLPMQGAWVSLISGN